MALTVGLVALASSLWLGLPLGAADPRSGACPDGSGSRGGGAGRGSNDIDRLRFTLTGEAATRSGRELPCSTGFAPLGRGLRLSGILHVDDLLIVELGVVVQLDEDISP